ncbi:MAG: hypothetical protein M3N93_06655 [Acidobacteriota bacterium]|nr:hypothetical protein [Acidobacteriota bacterium]
MRRLLTTCTILLTMLAPAVYSQSADDVNKSGSEHASRAGNLPVGKPGPGMVWVDAKKKIYYREGHPMYGKTPKGSYMSEGDAVNQGYVPQSEKPIQTNNSQ